MPTRSGGFLFLVQPVDFAQPKNGREGNAGSHQVRFQKGNPKKLSRLVEEGPSIGTLNPKPY